MPNNRFIEQVRLLVAILPHVAAQPCFALKGGTALNLFVHDLPRLSVDIDLAYLPVAGREESLAGIDAGLAAIQSAIVRSMPNATVSHALLKGTRWRMKLLVAQGGIAVKVEVTPVLRGSVYPATGRDLAPLAQAEFGHARMRLLSFEDLYGGKLCAALDRQHPRDLFDVRLLLAGEGLTPRLKNAFLVYLLGHNRPMSELLAPVRKDIAPLYAEEFVGMTREPVGLDELLAVRETMVAAIRAALTEADRQFLLAVKRGDADWSGFPIPEAERLPAVRWKLENLDRMEAAKRQVALAALERALYG